MVSLDPTAGGTGGTKENAGDAESRSAIVSSASAGVMSNGEGENEAVASEMPTADGAIVEAETGSIFALTKKEKSLSSQAEWYVYSSMQISKSEFESYWFRNMLQEVGDGLKTAILTPEMLRNFVRGEFDIFLLFLKVITDIKIAESTGHAYAQGLHDGGTLASKRKYQALAIQFIAPKFLKNLVVTIGLLRSKHNKDKDVATLWNDTTLTHTGHEFTAIVGRMRSDRAAKGVAGACGMDEEEVCEMHDTDKLGRVATGALVRTRNKTRGSWLPKHCLRSL